MFNPATRLPVYSDAMRLAELIDEFADRLPPYRRYLGLQVRRASLSVLLNLTEGATETQPKEKARMYRLARRSAAECMTAFDLAARLMPDRREAADALARRALVVFTQLHHLGRSLAPTPPLRGGKGRG